jgi:DNA-binding MarR family transcriptional regulator
MRPEIFNELAEKLYKAFNLAGQEMKTAWDYGIGLNLYHSEVHLLDMIKAHKGANASELSRIMGVTTGAVWQVSRKLLDKGLIENYQHENNKKEVLFQLTDLGKKACKGHQKHHETINTGLFEYMENLNEADIKIISEFLDVIIKGMSYAE